MLPQYICDVKTTNQQVIILNKIILTVIKCSFRPITIKKSSKINTQNENDYNHA